MLKELFSNRLFIGALAFFILSVVGGTLYISHVEKQGAEKLATDEDRVKQPTEKQQPKPTETAKTPVGDTSQGGHFHADGTWHAEPHETPAPPARYPSGDLTYHADLLDKHPVEALRQHAQEIGHWSADYIPPFPPEDTEAARYARNRYLVSFYSAIGETDNPEYRRAGEAVMYFFDEVIKKQYPTDNLETKDRGWDLLRLSWITLEDNNLAAALRADFKDHSMYPYGFPSEFNEEYQAFKQEMLMLKLQAQQE